MRVRPALALLLLSACAAPSRYRVPSRSVNAGPGTELSPGIASFYSDSLEGNQTANGEAYDPDALTAAHRGVRFGTRLRVSRDDNGRSVVVCVNDRGPFVEGRVIDLSRAAAEVLGMIRAGLVRVSLTVVEAPRSRRCDE